MTLSCVDCSARACRGKGGTYPDFCLTTHLEPNLLDESVQTLSQGMDNKLSIASAKTESDGYCQRCRIEDIMHLARLMGWKKLGIATCVGLLEEARSFAKILRSHGFEVYGVACKCGAVQKTEIGVPEECLKVGKNICNPVLQARVLNREGTDFNITVGLCVGHDSLFYKYSDAYVTTLIAKDRLLGHNPAAPLYTLNGYWSKILNSDPYSDAE